MYVTLEPCAHLGRTPPCVDAVIASGIRRCVVALRDPHRIVNGRGLRKLRAAGIAVEVGLLGAEAAAQIGGYLFTHTKRRPRVTLKLATSLDGRIAPAGGFARRGAARWLTGPDARRVAHRLRARVDAVVVGAGTARADDPRLTARGVGVGRQPLRVVCDTRLALATTLALFRTRGARTVVACGPRAARTRALALERLGVEVWRLPAGPSGVSPAALLRRLAAAGCHEVLLEGGAALAGSWLDAGVVDRVVLMLAPRVLGRGGLAWGDAVRRPKSGRFVTGFATATDLAVQVEIG
jgi:diaminohydroxyphosphoribosylaminopyrimidine deaminase/5-amino-6-(5-phosphoribosylamino)uracil reductase